jgi:CBS domain-containing protein
MTLSEVMHVHIPLLQPDSTFRDAVDKMDIYQFPALVITDSERTPIAVITEGDLARAVSAKGDVVGLNQSKALDFATTQPATADVGAEVSDTLHQMLTQGLTAMPVTMGGRLAGIVMRMDLMQAMLMDVSSPLPPE